jgi:hypothetical protein
MIILFITGHYLMDSKHEWEAIFKKSLINCLTFLWTPCPILDLKENKQSSGEVKSENMN